MNNHSALNTIRLALLAFFVGIMMMLSHTRAHAEEDWAVRFDPNTRDVAAATYGNCHVYQQYDGDIRLNVFAPDFDPQVPGWSGGVYHNVILKLENGIMKLESEFWLPAQRSLAAPMTDYRGPDLFWQRCSASITALPPSMIAAFKGYRGLREAK